MTRLPDVLTIPQTAAALGIARTSVYGHIHSGELRTTDVGTGKAPRTRVFADSVAAFLQRRASDAKPKGRAA